MYRIPANTDVVRRWVNSRVAGKTVVPIRGPLVEAEIASPLRRGGRSDARPFARAVEIQAVLGAPPLRRPPAVRASFAGLAATQLRLITALNSRSTPPPGWWASPVAS
jgi:hypothetical protein